jgi:hypothetical protein
MKDHVKRGAYRRWSMKHESFAFGALIQEIVWRHEPYGKTCTSELVKGIVNADKYRPKRLQKKLPKWKKEFPEALKEVCLREADSQAAR